MPYLKRIMAAAAMLAFLLHGAAAVAPAGHHVSHDAVSLAADDYHPIGAAGEHPDLARGDLSCCGVACSVPLLPLGDELTSDALRATGEAVLIHSKPGIEPEGIRRPPKRAA